MDHQVEIGCIFVIFSLSVGLVAAEKKTTTVATQDGTYVGYIYRFEAFGQNYATRRFLGIPYAEAPVGELRFNKPRRKAKLSGLYEAMEFRPSCLQQNINLGGTRKPGMFENMKFSEDCLYLNIFTPRDMIASTEALPVMIYIFGGGFVSGSTTLHASDIPSAYGNVVVVTIAYRLSIWGFLSTGDENLPGNYGLWDQQMAIHWVYDNIAGFGGDPEAITVYGLSAGGASVVYQSIFPRNKGIIKRAIAMSGSITCPWAFNSDPLATAKRLSYLVGCDTTVSTEALAACLKSKSTEELERVLNTKENGFIRFPMEFVTVIDGDFVPASPSDLFHGSSEASKRYQEALFNVDFMTGVTSVEGLMMIFPFVGVDNTDTFETDRNELKTELIPEIVRVVYGEKVPDIVNDLIFHEYTDWNGAGDNFNALQAFIKLSSDYVFNVHAVETAMLHSGNSRKNTYVYVYDIFPSTRLAPTPQWNTKPQHTDDLTTIFGHNSDDGYTAFTTPYLDQPPEDWELEFSKAHITMWTNFAKSGNPNAPVDVKSFINTTWPRYDTLSQRYLNITRQMSAASVGGRLFARATNFWWNVLPGILDAVGRSTPKSNEFCLRDGECEP